MKKVRIFSGEDFFGKSENDKTLKIRSCVSRLEDIEDFDKEENNFYVISKEDFEKLSQYLDDVASFLKNEDVTLLDRELNC